MKITYNYNKLRGLIREKFGSEVEFSKALGLSNAALNQRLNNLVPFKAYEIDLACRALGINDGSDMQVYFFTPK